MDNKSRLKEHKKNTALEAVFPELEQVLGASEMGVLNQFDTPKKKIFLIVGCARSGSTLLYQYLANTDYFFYPTNFLSRFYYAPYIGYRVQQALIDFDLKGEILPKVKKQELFKSNLGKTVGAKQPHEFWYFWNRFFKFNDTQKLTKKEINKVDWKTFLKELHALESATDKPILMKAMNFNWNLIDLKEKLPNVHFIYMKRDLIYNAQSLLQARQNFFGNVNKWYSFKPPEYKKIMNLAPEEQVVKQVLATNLAIEEQLNTFDETTYSVINYAKFCNEPETIIKALQGTGVNLKIGKKYSFPNGNSQKVPDNVFNLLKKYSQI